MTRRSTGFGQTVIGGLVVKTTSAAVLFEPDEGGGEFWIPRRVILDGNRLDEGDEDITVADWWLKQEGHL